MAYRAASIMLMGAVLAGAAAPVASAAPLTDPQEAARQLFAASTRASQGDCASALPAVVALLDTPGFAALAEQGKQAGYGLAATCEMILGKNALAYDHALVATRLNGPDPTVWRTRLWLELNKKDNAAALVTIEAMAAANQDALNATPMAWLYALDREFRDKPDLAARRRLLAVLSAAAYVPDDPGYSGDKFRESYATMLVDADDKAAAAKIFGQITDPFVLVDSSVDSRLSPLMPTDFDARAAFEKQITRFRDLAASHPGSLNIVVQIGRMLLVVGRPEEALATLQNARPDAGQGNDFADADDMRNWWWNGMAYSYGMLGRYEDAVAAFRAGVAAKERGRPNVSQTINLSQLQVRFGHARDALATLASFDGDQAKTSPYGAMAMREGRGCARFLTGDVKGAAADLDYALAHERDAAAVVTHLQLCMNDLTGAAASLIHRLANPDQRADALLTLSDYDKPLATLPPNPEEKNLDAVKTRPDVVAAIARAGGTRRLRI